MKTIGISMVGSGFMGKLHTLSIGSYPIYYYPSDVQPRLECIVGHTSQAAQEGMKQFGFRRAATDWRTLLTDEKTDVIVIATPNDLHRQIAIEAIRAGKHVFCEKPLGLNAQEAYEMYKEAERMGVVAACGHNNRALAAVRMIKRLMERGEFGTIYSIQMRYIQSWGMSDLKPMQWRFDEKRAGSGTLGDTGSHAIDIGRYLLGDVRRVCAVSRTFVKERNIYANALLSGADTSTLLGTQAVDVDDDIKTLVEFENGATGTLWSSRFCLGHEDSLDIEIYGSKGSARFSRERPNELEFYSSNDPSDERGFHRIKMGPEHPNGELWPMADLGIGYVEQKCVEYRDFFRAVAQGDPSLVSCSFYDGYKVCQFIDAAKQSSREGGWVVLENI